MDSEIRIEPTEKNAVEITIKSRAGHTTRFTVTADENSFIVVHGEWAGASGEVSEDPMRMGPIDRNTVELYI
uniref:Uncharacterized protein n=1 Tax=viral metagenome TaxID=1070528 RepID=A0A6M3J561_9ZZZZ